MLAIPGDGVIQQDASECCLSVRLPPEMSKFFDESGYIATVIGEQRSSARLRVRCEALIHSTYTPPFLMRLEKRARVLVKDLSRSGIGILLHQQMYPTERFWIELNYRRLHVTVVRCRKIGDACFEVGASIEAIEAL